MICSFFVIPTPHVEAFETKGGPGAVHPTLEALQIGKHIGKPIHQDITKDGLYFLKEDVKKRLQDVHVDMERDQSSTNHFDNCAFRGTVENINGFYHTAVNNLNPNSPDLIAAANAFGSALHPIQDFYSHSNWIEMNKTDLVDPWYSYWRDITPFSFQSNSDTKFFSLEIPPDGNTKKVFYASNALSKTSEYGSGDSSGSYIDKTIRVKENNTSYPRIGLISGTYGEPEENRCPPDASIPHGSVLRPVYTYADDETLDHPNELNKDNPERKGHQAARNLATKQTTHEFCRLVELVRGTWGERGVNLIYQNWVSDKSKANLECPPVQVTALPLSGSSGVHIADGTEIKLTGGIIGFSDGTIKLTDGTIILPDRTVVDPNGKKWLPDSQIDPKLAIAVLPDGTKIQINVIPKEENGISDKTEQENPKVTSTQLIPDWVKSNALWWSEDQIDDKSFALAIGFLVQENIIQVDSDKIDTNGSLMVSDNLVIPKWIQNNAKWWAEGKITDVDFREGIQFMVQEGIVSFEGHQKDQTDSSSLERAGTEIDKATKQKILQHYADALLANNAALEQLLQMQNFVGDFLDNITKEAWNNYSDNKNPETMESAIKLEELSQMMKEDSIKTVTALKDSTANIDLFFNELKENDFDDFQLKKNAEDKLNDLLEIPKIKSSKDLEYAEKNIKKIDQIIEDSIENAKQLGGVSSGEMPGVVASQSSRYSLTFESGSIETTPSTAYDIDSLTWAKTCTSSSDCNSQIGETCSTRNSEFSGRCIPTWFGICHAWEPVCVGEVYKGAGELISWNGQSTNENTSKQESTENDEEQATTYNTAVLVMGGANFPITQFTVWKWIGECDDSWHYHTQSGNAVSLGLSGKIDPDPENCGFGKVDDIEKKTVQITSDQVDAFMELTGRNPIGNDPIYGGSGP